MLCACDHVMKLFVSLGLCRPSKAQSGGFKPPIRASSSGPTVQTKLTSILERCKYTKKYACGCTIDVVW